jgi:elongation factor 2
VAVDVSSCLRMMLCPRVCRPVLVATGKPNAFVDMTKGAQYVAEIKDHVVSAFQSFTLGGILCDDVLRGCRFNLLDIMTHADTVHRGAGQVHFAV